MRKTSLLLLLLMALMAPWAANAQETVEIGDATSTSAQYSLPVNMYYNYSLTQQIYTAEEIGMAGTINSIAFDYAYTNEFSMENVQIYMMNVDKENFESTSDMVQISASDLVWEGTFTASATGWVTIDLNTPFAYDGSSNLLVCCYDPTSGYPGNSFKFRTTATTDYLALAYYSDSNIPSLEDVSTYNGSKYRYQYRTNIQLDITPSSVQPCYKPALAVSEITHNQATLTVGGGSGIYNVQYKLASATTWTNVASNSTNTTFTLSGLTPLTAYDVQAQSVCEGGATSDWKTANFNTTAQAELVGDAWSDDFEGATCGWELINGTLTNAWAWGTAVNNGGTHALYVSNDSGTTNAYTNNSAAMVYATKLLNFTEGKFEFAYNWMANGEANWDFLRVALVPASVSLTAGTSLPTGLTYSAVPSGWIAIDGGSQLKGVTDWQNQSVAVNVPAGNYYMVLAWRNDGSGGVQPPAAVDNVSITKMACDYDVTGLDVNNITTTTADVTWIDSEAGEWQVALMEGNGEWAILPNTYTTNSAALTGLTAATNYQVKVRAYCDAEHLGTWCEPISFATECVVPEALGYTENFDNYSVPSYSLAPPARVLPNCWSFINETTYSSYQQLPSMYYYSYTNYANSTPNCLKLYSYAYFNSSGTTSYDPQPQYAILPEMSGLADKQITLKARGYNTSCTFKVGLMTDPADASTFTEITNSENPASMTTSYQTYSFIIPSDATAHYVAIMIEAASSSRNYNGVYIDDIEIDEAPTCFQPKNLAVTEGSITAHEATLTWQRNNNGTENAWVLQCCVDDEFMCGNAGIFEVSGTPSYTLTGFQPETTYYVRVKPDCDTEGELWSDVVSFTTLALCPAPANFAVAQNGIDAHTATLEWEGTSESYSVSYRTAASLDATFEEHFTGLTSGIPTGWDNSEGTTTTDSYKWSYYNSGHDATPCVRFNSYNNGNGNTNFLKTPSMDFPDFTTMILSFWWKNPTGGDFSVYISTDGGATRALLKEGMTGQSTWKQETITLTDYVGASNVFIYFKGTSNWGNGDAYIYLDDVVIGSEVAAGEWLTVTGIEESTYTIEGLLAETTYEAKIQGNCGDLGLSQETELITFTTGIACYPPLGATYYPEDLKSDQVKLYWNGGDGTYYQLCLNGDESNLIDVEGTVYTWEGLDPETQYTVKVRSNCELSYPGDGVSEWSGTLTFTTLPDCAQPDEITFQAINHYDATLSWMGDSESFTVNYRTTAGIDGIEEEFGTSLPSGWENKSGLLSNVMGGSTFGSSAQWSFGSNNGVFDNHARINIYGSSRYGWLITPEFILASGAVFNFDLALTAYSGTGAASGTCDDDRFVVLVYANEAWTILREWNNSGSADVYNDIPTAGTNVSIDLSAYIGQTVKIAFYGESTESGNGDNNLHIDNVMIGTPFVAGEWQTVTTDQARATIENLTPGTEYEVVIVPSCDENAASDPVNFTTRSANAKIFAVEGDWGNADNWIPAGVPTTEQTVELQANATITGEAFAKSITGTGTGVGQHSLTIEDGGKLKHLEGGTITVTVKKNIRGYNTNYDPETYASGDYYLICNPLSAIFTPDENNGFLVGNYDLYNWQYDASDGLEWRNYRTTSFNLNTGVYGYLYANETGTTLYFTGNMLPYRANEIRSLSAPASPENYDFPGWYLLGNSYMYDAYLTDASENGNGLPYIKMNAAGDGFENIAAGTPIEPMEGFFYQATTTRTVYVSTYEPTVTSNGKLNINLRSANKQLDNAILMFGGNQQMGKMTFRENSSKVYMPVEGKDYAITTAEGHVGEMPVNFKAEKNGSYTLSFTNEDVDFSYLHLIDNLTGEDVDLLAGASTGSAAYTFNASTTDYESRFKLVFATGTSAEGDNFSFVNASGNLCIFGIEGEATVQVIDILGHVISSETFSGSYERKINGAPGVYMVRLINGNDVKVQKVVVR